MCFPRVPPSRTRAHSCYITIYRKFILINSYPFQCLFSSSHSHKLHSLKSSTKLILFLDYSTLWHKKAKHTTSSIFQMWKRVEQDFFSPLMFWGLILMLNEVIHFLWETNDFNVISNGEFQWLHGKRVPSLKYLEGSFRPPSSFHSLPSKGPGKGSEEIHLPQSSSL